MQDERSYKNSVDLGYRSIHVKDEAARALNNYCIKSGLPKSEALLQALAEAGLYAKHKAAIWDHLADSMQFNGEDQAFIDRVRAYWETALRYPNGAQKTL